MRLSSLIVIIGYFSFIQSCTPAEKKSETVASQESINILLSHEEFKSKLESTPEAVLLDVRTPEEVSRGVIKGAINVDYKGSAFFEKIKTMDKEKPHFVYCLSGKRSSNAATEMKEAGFKEIYTLKDGLQDWIKAGLPIEKH